MHNTSHQFREDVLHGVSDDRDELGLAQSACRFQSHQIAARAEPKHGRLRRLRLIGVHSSPLPKGKRPEKKAVIAHPDGCGAALGSGRLAASGKPSRVRRMASSAPMARRRGFDNGSNVGVEVSGPFGAEAIGDFPEDDTGTQRLFGAVVSWRNSTVGEEDEHVSSASLDDELQLLAGLMGRCDAH